MRYIFAVILAAGVGAAAYAAGLGPEVAYVLRSIVRHFAAGGS